MEKEISVVKRRDRGRETLNIEKIHEMVEYAVEGINGVSTSQVEMNSGLQFFDGITTDEIQQILVKSAADLISLEKPNYQYVAARLLLYSLRKQVFNRLWDHPHFYTHVQKCIDNGLYDKQIVDNAAEAVNEIKDIYNKTTENMSKINVKAIYENAKLQTELKNTAVLAMAENRRLIEQYDIQAEKLRQTRDDESATLADRIAANEQLGKTLEDQQKAMLANADLMVAAAQMEADANKDNVELQAALTDAIAEREGVIARVTGMQSEQLTNTNSLLKEQKDLERELYDFGVTAREQEFIDLEQELQDKLEIADKLGKGRKEIEEHYAKERVKLNKKFAQEDMENQLNAASGLLKAMSSFAGDNKELAAASAIIDTYVGANKAIAQGGIPGIFAAAGIILTGLANVRKIYATDVGDGGGGSTPSIDTPAVEQLPAPDVIQRNVTLSGTGAEPVRAYVVTDDIEENTEKIDTIRRKATI